MNKVLCLLILCLGTVSCSFLHGDGEAIGLRLNLSFPVEEGKTNQTVTVDAPQVQEAIELVHRVMLINRFKRENIELTPIDKNNGIVASYAGCCAMAFKGNSLSICFAQERVSKFSPDIQKVIDDLSEKLKERYGTHRVKAEKI